MNAGERPCTKPNAPPTQLESVWVVLWPGRPTAASVDQSPSPADHAEVLTIAGQGGPSPAPFLLFWGVVALVGGGALVTRRVSDRFRAMVVEGLATKPAQQARAEAVPLGFARFIGGVFMVCGMIAIPVAIAMMVKG